MDWIQLGHIQVQVKPFLNTVMSSCAMNLGNPDHLSKLSASEEALSTLEVICSIDTVNNNCNFSVILETR